MFNHFLELQAAEAFSKTSFKNEGTGAPMLEAFSRRLPSSAKIYHIKTIGQSKI